MTIALHFENPDITVAPAQLRNPMNDERMEYQRLELQDPDSRVKAVVMIPQDAAAALAAKLEGRGLVVAAPGIDTG